MVKIAVASTDGKVVNQHFGKADTFYILALDDELKSYTLSEIRKVQPVCYGGDHDLSQLQEAVKNLSDCTYLIASRIGLRAKLEFEQQGIRVFELPDLIPNAIERLARYVALEKLLQG